MQKSEYSYSDEAEAARRLLEEVEEQISPLEVNHPESVRGAALLQHGDMMIARQAVMALENESERAGLLSISYAQEARIKYLFLSYGNDNTKREALSCIEKAITLLPNPYYYFTQATIYADLGERDKAIQSLEIAVELGGSTKEEMQTELTRMKARFTLQDSRNMGDHLKHLRYYSSDTNSKTSKMVGSYFIKFSFVISIISIFIVFTIKNINENLYQAFQSLILLSVSGVIAGTFLWARSFLLKD